MAATSRALVLVIYLSNVNSYGISVLSNASTYIETKSEVYDIQQDAFEQGNILFSDSRVLRTTNMFNTWDIAGDPSQFSGYQEGIGAASIFYGITSFIQINTSKVLVIDKWNHCIRSVNRLTNETSSFAGRCTKGGYKNAHLDEALFFYPTGLARTGSVTVVADTYNMAIRLITGTRAQNNLFVSTLCKGGILRYPQFITIDTSTNLYVTVQDGVVRIPAGTNTPEALTSLKGGFMDGPLPLARFYNPMQVELLGDSLLTVDSGNKRIRLIDLQGNVTTLVQFNSKMLRSVLVNDGQLLVGGYQKIHQINVTVEWMTPEPTTSPETVSPNIYLPTTTPTLVFKKTVAFQAQYEVECSKLVPGVDVSVVKAVMAYRLTQLEDICQSDCRMSPIYKEDFYCTDDVLRAIWPVEMTRYDTNGDVSTELNAKIQQRVTKQNLSHFTLTFLFMEPPVRTPKVVCGNYLRLEKYVLDPRTHRWLPNNNGTRCL